jgi:hypothetical protein
VFTAERNEGLVAAERATCLIGSEELDCETKNYKVWVGGRPGKLSVSESKQLPGRDLGGEIVTADGRVIYRAELLQLANEPRTGAVAER